MGNEDYMEYFNHRGVTPAAYAQYQVPAHILALLPRNLDAKILDIGCGFGQFLSALKDKGYTQLTGIDISPQAVEHCRNKGLQVELIESLDAYAGQGQTVQYDFIIMSHVLEHIEKSRIIPILKMIRNDLLRPRGLFLLMVPNAQSNTGCYWAYEDFTHHLLFTSGSVLFCLQSAGFKHVRFLDPYGLSGLGFFKRGMKSLLLKLYEMHYDFWNRVTSSSFHKPSPRIFSFELKVAAQGE